MCAPVPHLMDTCRARLTVLNRVLMMCLVASVTVWIVLSLIPQERMIDRVGIPSTVGC